MGSVAGAFGGTPGHNDLESPLVIVFVEPVGAELHYLVVEIQADAPTHADHHGFALKSLFAALEVLHQITSDELQPMLGAHHGLQLGPAGLELLFLLDLFAFGRFFEVGVDVGDLGFIQGQFGQAAFVVDGDGGLVFNRPLDVIDADVVAEDGAGVRILELNGGAGETHEGGAG
ncbi:MAG: hypothetical protein BWY79_01892 [Actinobacteria bacterium ADurb.Bin444]|nr:MAG: hypothetical protein BWY79_01892 [Actinobacteria bacterium ADurb.Bin444]